MIDSGIQICDTNLKVINKLQCSIKMINKLHISKEKIENKKRTISVKDKELINFININTVEISDGHK